MRGALVTKWGRNSAFRIKSSIPQQSAKFYSAGFRFSDCDKSSRLPGIADFGQERVEEVKTVSSQ
jgi:hypothetical protein